MSRVASEQFDSRQLPAQERLAAYRHITAPLYEIQPLGDPAAFQVRAWACRVKNLIFNRVDISAATFRRGARHLRSPRSDFVLLQEQLNGELQLSTAHGRMRVLPGYLFLRDWGQPFEATASAMELRSVIIPRHLLQVSSTLTAQQSVLSLPLSEPTGRAIALIWGQLWRELSQLSLEEAERLCMVFLAALDAVWGLDADQRSRPTQEAMLHFLRVRLSWRVGVTDLIRHFRVSRSTVYRLFEPLGGVQNAIKQMRLEHCYAELWRAEPSRTRVADVGASWGFTEASSFSRSFSAHFGVPPSKVLGGGLVRNGCRTEEEAPGTNRPPLAYLRWLRDLAGPEAGGGFEVSGPQRQKANRLRRIEFD